MDEALTAAEELDVTLAIDMNAIMERHRREVACIGPGPLDEMALEAFRDVVGYKLTDYAEYGNRIDRAIHHLDEALPNGQLVRASAAIIQLREASERLEAWMAAKGYCVRRETLHLAMNGGVATADATTPFRLRASVFKFGNTLVQAQDTRMSDDGAAVTISIRKGDQMRLVKTHYTYDSCGLNVSHCVAHDFPVEV